MAKTFVYDRYHVAGTPDNDYEYDIEVTPESDGTWVKAEDAINREAVNADRIRTLELQLKQREEHFQALVAVSKELVKLVS